MIARNRRLCQLSGGYLFPEIQRRSREFLQQRPSAQLFNLGIGDTTEPLPPSVSRALAAAGQRLGTKEGYSGYGPEQGMMELRAKIAQVIYNGAFAPEEIFISDGANGDIARLQVLFGSDVTIAVQDPSYPVYAEGSLMQGVRKVIYLSCMPDNDFFPDLSEASSCDLLYFCSPNNPTGVAATRAQLQELVTFAHKHRCIILFDAAYSRYIGSAEKPRSIYEIAGAKEVAIEINSFSKMAGFTGVRLGWSVVPEALRYSDGGSIRSDWDRVVTTLFNGASNIAQWGGLAVLEREGMLASEQKIAGYKENAQILRSSLKEGESRVFGGFDAPFLWVEFLGKKSWEIFQELLEQFHILSIPGVGFGPSGEGFVRLSAFAPRAQIEQAAERLQRDPKTRYAKSGNLLY